MNVSSSRCSETGPSLTKPPCCSQGYFGLEINVRVPLMVQGLSIGAMNKDCKPFSNAEKRKYSESLSSRTLPSIIQVSCPGGDNRALKVYGPIGSVPALSNTWLCWKS